MNFITALIGTCKGTKVFIKLYSQSLPRTFWHLLMMTFICSLFIMLCTYSGTSQKIDKTFSKWKDNFGAIKHSKNGITAANTQTAKSINDDSNDVRLSYLPNPVQADLSTIDADDINFGFLWTPTMLSFWSKLGPDNFILIPLAYCSKQQLVPGNMKRSEILPYLKENTSIKDKLFCLFPELSWTAFRDYSKSAFFSATFFGGMIVILLRVLFFVAMFSFILNLSRGINTTPALKYRNRFIIGIYASFPPLMIASMFSAFKLPFLSFDSVYVICFSIYLITIFSRLQQDLNAQTQNKAP